MRIGVRVVDSVAQIVPKAANNSDMAKQLGISRRSLYRYKDLAGAPADLDIDAWKVFVASVRVNVPVESSDDPEPISGDSRESYAEARARKTAAQADIAQMLAETTKRNLIPKGETLSFILDILTHLRAKVLRLENEFPMLLTGLSPEEIHKIVREKLDGLLQGLSDAMKDNFFEPKPLA